MPRTAAALVIGNEILTGKVQEANVAALATELFALGIALRRVIVCPDDPEQIAHDVNALRARFDVVVTSGGVGPTHDDVTVPAIARAFGRAVVRDATLVARLRAHFGERTTEGHLRMAELPEGAELVMTSPSGWPLLRVDNVWVLPGVPDIFRARLPLLRERLGADAPFHTRAVYTRADEGDLAALLERIEAEHPGVAVGSYPRLGDPEYSVKITFDGRELTAVRRALTACVAALPPALIVRVDPA
jgi:molybdenum cofactor synthesis domain-containing protein